MNRESFIGVWSLRKIIKHISADQEEHPWGDDLAGQLIYTSTGHMSVVYMKKGRKRFESSDIFSGTDGEIREAFLTFDAYTGTYDIDFNTNTVIHHVLSRKSMFIL